MKFSLRNLLYWIAPTATVGTLTSQSRAQSPASVTVDTIADIPSRFLARPPLVRVFLPGGYHQSRERLPVLFANDGQDMEAVHLAATIDSMVGGQAIRPFLLVAVHAGEDRLQNYGTAGQLNAQQLGAQAGAYESFLVQELLPVIQRRYRVERGPAAIMGWSLGGLSAFDIAWRRSDKFGKVGVFSGSFWWRTDDSSIEAKQQSRIMHRRVGESARKPALQAWFEVGRDDEKDDRDGNGVIDAIQDTRELMDEMRRLGFKPGTDLAYVEVDGGHNPETWARALPQFLEWAFGSR